MHIRAEQCSADLRFGNNSVITWSAYVRNPCTRTCVCVASELHRPSGHFFPAKFLSTFVGRGESRGQCKGSPRSLISVFWTAVWSYMSQYLWASNKINKNFWQDLIVYFPSIWLGPHRNRRRWTGARGLATIRIHTYYWGGVIKCPVRWAQVPRCTCRVSWRLV
jgi:hypothetical protein